MSQEQIKAFMEAVKADAELQEQLKAAGDADAVVAIARTAGFLISVDELSKKAHSEISDDELEGLTGGGYASMEVVRDCGWTGGAEFCFNFVVDRL
jgi:predicted ribosomally synthesized peptide with nif11-like leader